jgi:hypothetical protein
MRADQELWRRRSVEWWFCHALEGTRLSAMATTLQDTRAEKENR